MVESRYVRPSIQLTDITDHFIESTKKIPVGHLVKDEGFTLFEAVGALEIGDPKMDSGALEDGDDLEDDFDFLVSLTSEQVIWIINELLCREVSWHQGYPLSQTLFTSVHLDKILWPDPKQISDAHFLRPTTDRAPDAPEEILRAYCLGLIKCCDLALAMISTQHFYEEEDFATQIYNREMLRSFTTDQILDIMRAAKGLDSKDTPQRPELIQQLDFRIAFLELLSEAGAGTHLPKSKTLVLLDSMKSSQSLGDSHPSAFSIKIQRRLASSVPPRPMVTASRTEAFTYLARMLADVATSFEMFASSSAADLFTSVWTFMSQPSATPCVYVRSLVQSFLTIDNKVLGSIEVQDMISDDLQAITLPASSLIRQDSPPSPPPATAQFQAITQVTQFIDKVRIPFINQFRSFALNRSRVRRNLCHAAIEWDNIQADAEEIDGYIQTLTDEKPLSYGSSGDADDGSELAYAYPLSSWVYHYKLLQLRLLIQMGFELEIYAPFEYVDMYWYLSHISGLHLSHLERMSFFVSQSHVSGNQQKMAQKDADESKAAAQKALTNLYTHFTHAKAIDTLASALQRIYVVIARHDPKFRSSEDETYSSDELRYELRTRPFAQLSVPEPLAYSEMKAASSLETLEDKEALHQAGRLGMTARKAWEEVLRGGPWSDGGGKKAEAEVLEKEWVRNIRGCMKACIAAGIAVTSLLKVVERNNGPVWENVDVEVPSLGNSARFHDWWAVPKIVVKS